MEKIFKKFSSDKKEIDLAFKVKGRTSYIMDDQLVIGNKYVLEDVKLKKRVELVMVDKSTIIEDKYVEEDFVEYPKLCYDHDKLHQLWTSQNSTKKLWDEVVSCISQLDVNTELFVKLNDVKITKIEEVDILKLNKNEKNNELTIKLGVYHGGVILSPKIISKINDKVSLKINISDLPLVKS